MIDPVFSGNAAPFSFMVKAFPGSNEYKAEDMPAIDYLILTHDHYDHEDADKDINIVFPIDLLRELAAEGFISGIARKHIGYMGYTMQLKQMYETTAVEIANEIDKGSAADAVILTGG